MGLRVKRQWKGSSDGRKTIILFDDRAQILKDSKSGCCLIIIAHHQVRRNSTLMEQLTESPYKLVKHMASFYV